MPLTDCEAMCRAIELARKASDDGEVPIGAVIVDRDGNLLSEGFNRRETKHDALAHAEIEAIHGACEVLGGWRLSGCTLYVTLEPCPMCAGAIINARITRVVFGADDPKAGSCGSLTDLFALPYNHHPVVERGLMEEDCAALLREFFRQKRKSKKMEECPCEKVF